MKAEVSWRDSAGVLHGVGRQLWRWVLLCAAAEFAGIGLAALWYGAVSGLFGEPDDIVARSGVWLLITAAAVPEGLVLGGLQVRGLHWFLPELSSFRFVVATVVAGVIGWGVGSFLPLFVLHEAPIASGVEPSVMAIAAFAAIFGTVAGTLFGACQAWALPVNVSSRFRWIGANALGWLVGLPLIYFGAQLAADFDAIVPRVLLWASGGGAAGLAVGLATAGVIPALQQGRNGGMSAITS